MDETIAAISAAFGSKVNYSQVTRAMWSILAGAEDAIWAESKRAPNLRMPSKGTTSAWRSTRRPSRTSSRWR